MAEIDELFGETKEKTMNPYNKDEWIKQKQEARSMAYDMLKQATEELSNPDIFMNYLEVQSRFDRYSVSNALLISHQLPDATRLGDSKMWQKSGAFIKKGEKAIVILEPGKEFTRRDGTSQTPYEAKKLFDISQTTAKPRAERTTEPNYKVLVAALVKTSPVAVEIADQLPDNMKAIYQPEANRIFVKRGMDGPDIFQSLAKEIAVAKLDKADSNKDTREFAAESIAYIVCKRAGIEPAPVRSGYQTFAELDSKDKRKELSTIRENSNTVSLAISKQIKPPEVDRDAR